MPLQQAQNANTQPGVQYPRLPANTPSLIIDAFRNAFDNIFNSVRKQSVSGAGAGTYVLYGPHSNGSITITSEGTVSSITPAT